MIKEFLGWAFTFVGVLILLQWMFTGEWVALFISVAMAALVVAALEWLFGGR